MTAAIDAMKAAQTYAIDKTHSEAAFQVRHLLTKVRGRFTEFAGTAVLDQEHPEQSSASLTIDASSVDTARRIVTRTCGPTKRVDSWSGTRCKSLFRLRQSCGRRDGYESLLIEVKHVIDKNSNRHGRVARDWRGVSRGALECGLQRRGHIPQCQSVFGGIIESGPRRWRYREERHCCQGRHSSNGELRNRRSSGD